MSREDEIRERLARRMQDWAEYGTYHLSDYVPKSWDEDDPDWWTGLAEVALKELEAEK